MKTGTENRRDRATVSPGSATETTTITVTNALKTTRNRRVLAPEAACANRGKALAEPRTTRTRAAVVSSKMEGPSKIMIRPTGGRSRAEWFERGEGLSQ